MSGLEVTDLELESILELGSITGETTGEVTVLGTEPLPVAGQDIGVGVQQGGTVLDAQ